MPAVLEPFQAPFMQRALVEVLLLSIPAGCLGAWIVVRRLAFLTHAVGHATFPALVVATLAGWSVMGTSVLAALAIAALLAWLGSRPHLAGGVAVAVLLSTALGLGAVLVSDIRDPGVRANGLLFGSLLAITGTDLMIAALVAAGTVIGTLTLLRGLTLSAFQREYALATGSTRTRTMDLIFLALLAVSVAVSVRVVGSLLVAGILLIPSATARLMTRRIVPLIAGGTLVAACTGTAGLWIAYQLGAPPGATVATLGALLFVLTAATRAIAQRTRQMRAIPT